ncbi:MAG: hypothetical protein QOJ69_204 [Actinomycetota bacterium]|nr:hypothetical protein [Actinomycetota bacterium]
MPVICSDVRPVVRLRVHPGQSFTFGRFCEMKAPAIALDGCVQGPSKVSAAGPHASFNHHEGVDRLSTRATCEQVLLSVSQGLWDQMQPEGEPEADVHVNDADPDVCTAVWVLHHPELADHPAVQRLVAAEGILDTTGAYWCPAWVDEKLLAELAWVFEPYHLARDAGLPADAEGLHRLIIEVAERITAHVDGRGERRPAWGEFHVVAKLGSVAAIVESGPYARMAVGRAGIQAVVAERESAGRRIVTLAKASPFVPVDLVDAYRRLNEIEACPTDDQWGGSDLIGGSPRGTGTLLPLGTILEIVAGS